MRVNVDEQALRDRRFALVGLAVGRHAHHVLGDMLHIWADCYQRRSETIDGRHIRVITECDGFAAALVAEQLADDLGDGKFRLRGIRDRIGWLLEQDAKREKAAESKERKRLVREALGDVPREVPREVPGHVPGDVPLTLTLTPDNSPTRDTALAHGEIATPAASASRGKRAPSSKSKESVPGFSEIRGEIERVYLAATGQPYPFDAADAGKLTGLIRDKHATVDDAIARIRMLDKEWPPVSVSKLRTKWAELVAVKGNGRSHGHARPAEVDDEIGEVMP